MLWGCFAARGTGALHKIDGIMRLKNYMDILKQHLKTSVSRKWVIQMDNDPKHTSKVVAKWLKDNKVKVLEWPSQCPDLNTYRKCVGRTEKACASKKAYKSDSVTPAVRRNGPTFRQSYQIIIECM